MSLAVSIVCSLSWFWQNDTDYVSITGLILGLHPANERRRYKVTPSLIDWAQTDNQSCIIPCKPSQSFGIIQNKPINIWIPYISNAERQTTLREIYLYNDEGK